MVKALLKKQLLESVSFLFVDAKKQKKRAGSAGFWLALILFAALFSVCTLFWHTGDMLCKPLVESGLTWVYFARSVFWVLAFGFWVLVFISSSVLRPFRARFSGYRLGVPRAPVGAAGC